MLEDVKNTVVSGRLKKVEGAVQDALDEGATAQEVLDAMMEAMDIVGSRFQKNEIYVPEMLVAAKTMQRGVGVLKPLLGGDGGAKYGKYVIGTVAGDLHDIGKNLVKIMMETAGFEMYDLGRDVPLDSFVEKAKEVDADLIMMSTLMTTTMPGMREVINKLKEQGMRDSVKVMVGGSPISMKYAEDIGADGYSRNAVEAVEVAKKLCGMAD